jgi:hypothetical protein
MICISGSICSLQVKIQQIGSRKVNCTRNRKGLAVYL